MLEELTEYTGVHWRNHVIWMERDLSLVYGSSQIPGVNLIA